MKFSEMLQKTIIMFIALAIFSSCTKNNEFNDAEVDFNNAFNNEIFAKIDGTQLLLNEKLLTDAFKSSFEIDRAVQFEGYKITKGKNANSDKTFYILQTRSKDGTISISNTLQIEDGHMALGEKTCKCETQTCSWSGCDASQSGGNCYCSHCSGDCKKTSTATLELFGN